MGFHMIPVAVQLAEVERLLSGDRHNEALRAIAADLQARLDGVPTLALARLE